ncbi:MAG: hypothetical protein HN657_06205 [Candidatus Marinimicrobia bacterium]|jgi:hypothetical protein|nr:hypothetical protein [Candidatus Neomarinimicrobiota bacterium]MBT3497021.1 hypothetical protein [Candidatus Neomarinimicrobiota bacterium]MBT3692893.1 hypothetical protein [Candidatus Neomarinimicrobiota bacterium]MBT3731514.1 hypothetical protein [Candidatus Neomarinimicrobiota bacterium]MBT4145134.1 hypothetical protein [Candidatus Neomarinimicrobiota bacterium]
MNTDTLIHVQNPEIKSGLKEIEYLREELGERESEKTELDKLIHDFNIRHQQECGRLIIQLLTLRKDKLKKKADSDFEWKQAYDNAGKAFHDYQKIFDAAQIESQWTLSDDEQTELKDLFRKSSKCCHPDMVEDDLEDEAGATFHELKSAYNQNDLNRVREIWESLESEKPVNVSSLTSQDMKKIQLEIIRLKSQLKIVKSDLKELKNSPAFIQVILLDDWDEYFKEKKRKLEQEIQHMNQSSIQ